MDRMRGRRPERVNESKGILFYNFFLSITNIFKLYGKIFLLQFNVKQI